MNRSDRSHHVLLALQDAHSTDLISQTLTGAGHTVLRAQTEREVLDGVRREAVDVVMIDSNLESPRSGIKLALTLLERTRRPEVVVLGQRPNVSDAVTVAKAGAFDYATLPLEPGRALGLVIGAAQLATARNVTDSDAPQFDSFSRVFLSSEVSAVKEMVSLCRMVASGASANALILGETGSGKETVARIIHSLSAQARAPMLTVNLLDLDPAALERKLCGDPDGGEAGLLAAVDGGTLVLKELGDLSSAGQARLLQALARAAPQEMELEPNVRILATTEQDLARLANHNRFSPDLFYRLASVLIRVPSLRYRADDIPAIAQEILGQASEDAGRSPLELSPGAIKLLVGHSWPGNIRELRNVLTRLVLLMPEETVEADAVSSALSDVTPPSTRHTSGVQAAARAPRRTKSSSIPGPSISGIIAATLDDEARAERERIKTALADAGGHREKAANQLGMSRTTLWTRMRLLGIDYEKYVVSKAQ